MKKTNSAAYLVSAILSIAIFLAFPWISSYLSYQANATYNMMWVYCLIAVYVLFFALVTLSLNWQARAKPLIRLVVEAVRAVLGVGFPLVLNLMMQNMIFMIGASVFVTNFIFTLVVFIQWTLQNRAVADDSAVEYAPVFEEISAIEDAPVMEEIDAEEGVVEETSTL